MWLEYGPETACRWAELTGLDTPAVRFSDPAKQQALEKTIKDSSKAKTTSTGKQPNPRQSALQPRNGTAARAGLQGQNATSVVASATCRRSAPRRGVASGKGLRPPMPWEGVLGQGVAAAWLLARC